MLSEKEWPCICELEGDFLLHPLLALYTSHSGSRSRVKSCMAKADAEVHRAFYTALFNVEATYRLPPAAVRPPKHPIRAALWRATIRF